MPEKVLCEARHAGQRELEKEAAPGMHLCDGCIVGLQKDLAELVRIHDELMEEGVSGTGPSTEPVGFVTGSRGDGKPELRYNRAAIEAAGQIAFDVEWAYKNIRRDRRLPVMSNAVSLGAMVEWLGEEVGWIAGNRSYAVAFRDTVRGLVSYAVMVLDPKSKRIEVGPCIEKVGGEKGVACTGTVYMKGEGPRCSLACNVCGKAVPVRGWAKYGVRRTAATVNVKGDLL
jgi:hypothetical protein